MKLLELVFTKQQIRDRLFWIRLGLALIMIVILIAQLFTYENFYDVMAVSQANLEVIVIGALIVIVPIYELASLPALLSMDLKKSVIRASAYIARIVSIVLASLALNSMLIVPGLSSGLMGETINVPAHVLTLIFAITFAAAIWYATQGQVEQPNKK